MGPVFWILLETSITKGFRAAVAFDLGVIIADTCFITICYLGSFQLLEDEATDKAYLLLAEQYCFYMEYFLGLIEEEKTKSNLKLKDLKRII